ncbi:MAG: hypothetical protein H0Z38_00415 [Firmicutes bacterium]|nr:hypothetical protein [Bacillota bacterium]
MKRLIVIALIWMLLSSGLSVHALEWRFLGLTWVGGSLNWVIEVEKSSETSEPKTSFLQELEVFTRGYVYHPYLLDFTGQFNLSKRNGSVNEFKMDGGTVAMNILRTKPYFGRLSLGKKELEVNPRYYEPYNIAQKYLEAGVFHNTSHFPGFLKYCRTWNNGLDSANLYNTEEESVSYEVRNQFTRDMEGRLVYEDYQVIDLNANRIQRNQDLKITASSNFVYELIHVDTSLYKSRRSGSFNSESQRITAKGSIHHDVNLTTHFNTSYANTDYHNSINQSETQGNVKTTWKVTPSVEVFVGASAIRVEEAGTLETLQGDWGLRGQKEYGDSTVFGRYEFFAQEMNASGERRFHFSEELTFKGTELVSLTEHGVLVDTIEATDSKTGERYVPGEDYACICVGDEIYLVRLATGDMPDPTTAVVSYIFLREHEAESLQGNVAAIGIKSPITKDLNFRGEFELTSQLVKRTLHINEGFKQTLRVSAGLDYEKDGFYGDLLYSGTAQENKLATKLGWQRCPWQATWEQQYFQGEEFVQISERQLTYELRTWGRSRGQLTLTSTVTKREGEPREDLFQAYLQLDQHFNNYIQGKVRAGYRWSSLKTLLNDFFLRYGLDYRQGQLNLEFKGEYDYNFAQDASEQKYRLGINRLF